MEKLSYEDPERPKILALDLDGTLLHYDGGSYAPKEFGAPIRGMVEELNRLREAGWKIVIWSCRPESPELREHLDEHEVPYDYINDHPWNGPDGPRKIHADAYLDDKGFRFNGIAEGLANRIMSTKPWWQEAAGWI
jgi:hypothetical protein